MDRTSIRLADEVHEASDWRIHAIVPDFTLEDVWAVPVEGRAEDFPRVVDELTSLSMSDTDSAAARFLWALRDRLGAWLHLGRTSVPAGGDDDGDKLPIPGTDELSLADRLPADLRGTADDVDFGATPFVPLYRTDDEFAAEISNATVHGVLHLGWADLGDGRFGARMTVYVRPRGLLGRGYMELIKPFRHWIVYPALMRQVERTWQTRADDGASLRGTARA